MDIRPLAPGDVPALAAMLSTMAPWTYYGVDAPAWERSLRSLGPADQAYVAVAEDGALVGYVLFQVDSTFGLSGYVRHLAVRPDRAGQGLGRQILAFAEEQILARGPNVFLLCNHRNVGAQGFYRAMGYTEVGRIHSYILAGEDEILFRKTTGPVRT